jgi:ATP-dependent RNA helicase DeaD
VPSDAVPSSSASRATSVVHLRPLTPALIADVLRPALERIDPAAATLQLLVLVPDPEDALAVADEAARLGRPLVPVTSVARGARRMAASPTAIAVAVAHAAELRRRSLLPCEALRTVIVLDGDTLAAHDGLDDLESLLAEAPREASRVLTAVAREGALVELLARHFHKARTLEAPVAVASPATIHYAVTSRRERGHTLARVLDALDPASVAVVATTEAQGDARDALTHLGYAADDANVVVTGPEGIPDGCALAVLWEPPTAAQLAIVAGRAPLQVLALVGARDVAALRATAAAATLVPWTADEALRAVRAADARLRSELTGVLGGTLPLRELTVLEPLFERHDAALVAAATLRLLDRARAQLATAKAAAAVPVPTPAAREASHPAVPQKRPAFREAPAERPESANGGFRGGRPDRAERGERREFRGRDDRPSRGPRPPRGDRPERSDRPARSDRPERPPMRGIGPKGFGRGRGNPRGPEEGGDRREWQERGDRLKHAKRRPGPRRED